MNDAPLKLGIMGGMFDPVHAGHFNAARLARQSCGLDRVLLMPCGVPVHREASATHCTHRIAMLQLLADEHAWLEVDTRECASPGVSRTWDSVSSLRQDYPGSLLFLVVGMDSLLAFSTWYRWQELLEVVNLVVIARPGYSLVLPDTERELQREVAQRRIAADKAAGLADTGSIVILDDHVMDVSSTGLRRDISRAQDPALQLHPAVQQYIEQHGLYRQAE